MNTEGILGRRLNWWRCFPLEMDGQMPCESCDCFDRSTLDCVQPGGRVGHEALNMVRDRYVKGPQCPEVPTSAARREVAEKLRHASHTDAYLDLTIAIAILETVGEVHRPIAAVVADLIDPTCHMVDTDHDYEDSIRCDLCQMTFNRPWEPFKFCPNCGARVVDDDD